MTKKSNPLSSTWVVKDKEAKKNTEYEQHFQTEQDVLEIHGYVFSLWKTILAGFFCFITFGLLILVFHWKPEWRLLATYTKSTLKDAQKILILEIYQKKWRNYHVKEIIHVTIDGNTEIPRYSYQNENFDHTGDNVDVNYQSSSVKVYFDDGSVRELSHYRMFRSKKNTYIWDDTRNQFFKKVGMEKSTTCMDFHNQKGYSKEEQNRLRIVYGLNLIHVPVQGIVALIFLEFFNPFYMFQVFSVIVWLFEEYYYYCIAIVVMSVFGITTSVRQTRKNQQNLQSTAQSSSVVKLCRNINTGEAEEVDSKMLVPGDLIIIPQHGCIMDVDAVILNGSCIVNESMLTGESVPVTKTPISHHERRYDMKMDSNHTLFCGTKVIQTRSHNNESVKAVVLRTGFLTVKGELVRSIMYPLPADFKFDRDSYKFIIILSIIAALGLIYTITLKAGRSFSAGDIIIKSLDILTIVIPPALPAAMTFGRYYATQRLRRSKIFCMNPRVINVCGSINCVCFDKTGTLTEDGLDMWGVIPTKQKKKMEAKHIEGLEDDKQLENFTNSLDGHGNKFILSEPVKEVKKMDDEHMMKIAMSVCQSLTYIDGELAGDPLEVKMFESTGWVLEEVTASNHSLFGVQAPAVVKPPMTSEINESQWGVVHQYQFSSSLQRSSVICKKMGMPNYTVVSKGSPEMISKLSLPETVPSDLKVILSNYTRQGYRVLAMGSKELVDDGVKDIHKLQREAAEKDLNFLGLMVLENKLKVQSKPVIDELTGADIKVIMITGDNLDTAVSVASECGILCQGDRLVKIESLFSDEKDEIPSLQYTQSFIKSSELQRTNTMQTNSSSGVSDVSSFTNFSNLGQDSAQGIIDIEGEARGHHTGKIKIIMDGNTWETMRKYFPDLLKKLIVCGAVFARMSSDQKQALVQDLQSIGYYVAMCGDGANDCGALKAAHAGISVSGQESSVASPFTYQEGHVGCVPSTIREGRAALTTSFGLFKFMVAYSLTEFTSVAFLYYFDSNLTDFQFLYIDIALSMNFALVFGRTQAYVGKICKTPPTMSLLGFVSLFSLILQLLIIIGFQFGVYFLLSSYPWYILHDDEEYFSYENYSIFCMSMFQYITLAIAFSHGSPYRKNIFTNYYFILTLLLTIILAIYITIYPAQWVANLLELKVAPEYGFRIVIVGLGFVNFVICLIAEKFLVVYLMQNKKMIPQRLREDVGSRNSHRIVEGEFENDTNWPPLGPSKQGVSIVNQNGNLTNSTEHLSNGNGNIN